jgi:hypothetical protein
MRKLLLAIRCWLLGHDDGKAHRTGTGVDLRHRGYVSHCGFCDRAIVWNGDWNAVAL